MSSKQYTSLSARRRSAGDGAGVPGPGSCAAPRGDPQFLEIITFQVDRNMGTGSEQALWKKLKANAEKYPVSKAKGSERKYTDF